MATPDIERGEEMAGKEHDDKEEDDLIKLLEQFSDKLGAVEKEVLEPAGRNRRRRNVDDRGPSTGFQVQEEVRSLQDEVYSQRRIRPVRRPKTSLHRAAQVLFLLLVAALMYAYWNKISQQVPSLHWPMQGGSKGHSWFERLHSTEDMASNEGGGKAGAEAAVVGTGAERGAVAKAAKDSGANAARKLRSLELGEEGKVGLRGGLGGSVASRGKGLGGRKVKLQRGMDQ